MNIKKETIEKHRRDIQDLIEKGEFKKGLEIASKYPFNGSGKEGFVITKTRLLNQYDLTKDDLLTLNFIEKDNPHYKGANKMTLYFEPEVKSKFKLKLQ